MAKALYLKGTDQLILHLSDRQFDDLTGLLEEEAPGDRDYYVDGATISFLEEKGCDEALVAALRQALGARGIGYDDATMDRADAGIDVEWREE